MSSVTPAHRIFGTDDAELGLEGVPDLVGAKARVARLRETHARRRPADDAGPRRIDGCILDGGSEKREIHAEVGEAHRVVLRSNRALLPLAAPYRLTRAARRSTKTPPMGEFTKAHLTRAHQHAARAAVERFAGEAGLVVAQDGEPEDRAITITDGGGGWTLVADSSRDTPDPLGCALGGMTVACTLTDGDITLLTLFGDGTPIARCSTGEGASIGRSRAWADVLAGGISLDQFYGALEHLADTGDAIDELAPLLGCSARALRGVAEGGVTLRFRLKERPLWEQVADGPGRLVSSPPRVGTVVKLRVGERHRVHMGGQNEGGAFRGMRIEIGGDAVTRGLLVPTVARVDVSHSRAGGQRTDFGDARTVVLDVQVTAGRVGRPTVSESLRFGASEALHAGYYALFVDVVAHAPGTGELRIAYYPADADASAGVVEETTVVVDASLG